MNARSSAVVLTVALLLLVTPAAVACNLPNRAIGPLSVSRSDLRRPVERQTTLAGWRLRDAGWQSVPIQLDQVVRTRRAGTHVGVSFLGQTALRIAALPPDTYGWRWIDDDDPTSPACALAGKHEWESPRILIDETATHVRVLAVSRRTPGSTDGCVFEELDDALPCPNLTIRNVRLTRAVGRRTLVFEQLPTDD